VCTYFVNKLNTEYNQDFCIQHIVCRYFFCYSAGKVSVEENQMSRKIALGIFLLAIIFFLMPWVNISCAGNEIFSASGFDMVRGSYNVPTEVAGETPMENEPIAIAALAVAGVGFIIAFFRGGFGRFLRVLAGIAGVALMVWLKFRFDDQIHGQGQGILQLNYMVGYWLTLGAFAVAAVVSLFKSEST
jgi:hypothetical protein